MDPRIVEQDLEQFHQSSFGWALACCRWSRPDAEEALQAAYLKAIDGKARFNGHASVKTWFFGVIKHTALEQRRNRITRDLAFGRWLQRGVPSETTPTPEQLSSDAQTLPEARLMTTGLTMATATVLVTITITTDMTGTVL